MPGIRSAMLKRLLPWLLAAAAIAAFLVVSLPLLAERMVLPPLLAGAGLTGLRVQVSRFGPNGCTIHLAGRPEAPPPAVSGNVRIDWTVFGLLRGRIDGITCDSFLLDAGRFRTSRQPRSNGVGFPLSSTASGLPIPSLSSRAITAPWPFRSPLRPGGRRSGRPGGNRSGTVPISASACRSWTSISPMITGKGA